MAAVSAPGWADAVVNTSLDLTNFTIVPSSGTVTYSSPTSASVFAQALDGLGGSDQTFNNMTGSLAQTMAETTLANGNASANGAPPFDSAVDANILIPGLNTFASSEGQGTLSGVFEITGTTGPVNVTFNVDLTDDQFLQTDLSGLSGSSQSIFTLTLPDIQSAPVLSFNNLLTVTGPNQTQPYVASPMLTTSLLLQPNVQYSFVAAPDAESYAVDSTPEPSSITLALIGLALVLLARLRKPVR
jgi:PEP-CTERM motif